MPSFVLPWRNKTFQLLATGLAVCLFLLIVFVDKEVYLPNGSNVPLQFPAKIDLEPSKNGTTAPNNSAENPGAATNATNILLVSAFFPLGKSKHSNAEYKAWLTHFLGKITTDVYFFAPPEWEPIIRSARGGLPITVNTTYSSPFDIHPLRWTKRRYREMRYKDREQHIHSVELYAVWNAKPWLLDQAVKNQAAGLYKYAFWNDAGTFRDPHTFKNWPDPERVEQVWKDGAEASGSKPEDLIFFPMHYSPNQSIRYWQEEMGPIDNEFSEASFFGGTPHAISWYRQVFYKYHNYYLKDFGHFVGKDQTLINALFLLFPQHFITVWNKDPIAPQNILLIPDKPSSSLSMEKLGPPLYPGESPLGTCGDGWFYYQFFLSSPPPSSEQPDAIQNYLQQAWKTWTFPWPPNRWWTDAAHRRDCRITRTLSIESILKRESVFGPGWHKPLNSQGFT